MAKHPSKIKGGKMIKGSHVNATGGKNKPSKRSKHGKGHGK